MHMFLYIAAEYEGDKPTSYVKIGSTINLEKRLAALQHASPREIRFVSTYPQHSIDIEREIHNGLKPHRVRGEWFRISIEQVTFFVEQAIAAHDALGKKLPVRERVSPTERVALLPKVFDHRDIEVTFNWTAEQARSLCCRLVREGVAEAAGKRAPIYYNLFLEPKGRSVLLGDALRKLSPAATLIGATALNAGGWTTQIPHILEVAMPRTRLIRCLGQPRHGPDDEW